MADKTLKTRIKLKYDTLANWQGAGASVVLMKGEVAICEVPTSAPSDAQAVTPPAILFKVGDGQKTFAQLPWVSGLAADVYSWAKQSTKPTYTATEVGAAPTTHTHTVSQITDFTDEVNSLIDIKIAEIPEVDVPEYTLETGTTEGSVVLKKDGVTVGSDVIIQGYSALKTLIQSKQDKLTTGSVQRSWLDASTLSSLSKADTALQSVPSEYATDTEVAAAVSTHNTSSTAHTDIRNLISTLSSRVDDLGNALHFVGAGSELPSTGENGDVFVGIGGSIAGKEYVYVNGEWEEFGSGDHITKAQADGYYDSKGTAQNLINALDGAITGTPGVANTLTALSQTDGKITATFSAITLSQGAVTGLTAALADKLEAADLDGYATETYVDNKVGALDKIDTAVSGQYVSAVSQTDGIISVTRAALPTVNTGKLLGADGTELFNANQSGDSTIAIIDCGSATELID